jgi:hypothetical protein
VNVVPDTRGLFHHVLREVLRDMGLQIPENVEFYTVMLLDEMGKIPYDEEPLGPKMFTGVYPERITILKDVGDRALFVSGFFGERLQARGIAKEYYAGLGAAAYGELASRWPDPFKAMATHVRSLQGALEGVREACDSMGMDVWSVHERWLQTRSPALERRMAKLGMIVLRDGEA